MSQECQNSVLATSVNLLNQLTKTCKGDQYKNMYFNKDND